MRPAWKRRVASQVLLCSLLVSACSVPSFLPDHGTAATLANELVVDLFVKADIRQAAASSDVYWGAIASSEHDYLAATRNKSVVSLGGNPESILLVSHLDSPRTGTMAFYYVAKGPTGRSVNYFVQVTQENRGLLIRAVFVGDAIPPPNDVSELPAQALSDLVTK